MPELVPALALALELELELELEQDRALVQDLEPKLVRALASVLVLDSKMAVSRQ